jgi:hypothetical protein
MSVQKLEQLDIIHNQLVVISCEPLICMIIIEQIQSLSDCAILHNIIRT